MKNFISYVVLTFLTVFYSTISLAYDENFYKDKTLRIVLGTAPAPGSSLELNARIFSRYLAAELPGKPSVVINNIVGGAGITAINTINNDKTGTLVGFPLPNIIMLGLLKNNNNIEFSSNELNWIGTPDDLHEDAYIVFLRNEVPNDFTKVIIGDTSETKLFDIPSIFHRIVENRSKLIYGYKTKDEVVLAFKRNEINSFSIGHTNLVSRYNIEEILKIGRPIIQFGHRDRINIYKDVPTFYELVKTDDQRMIIDFLQMIARVNKPIVMGKDVEPWKVAMMREAFNRACMNQDLIQEMKKFNFPVSCMSGLQVQDLIIEQHNKINKIKTLIEENFKQ
jgi:hypothetical protein